MTGFYYLATPYSKHPRGTEAAFQEAIAAAVTCIRAGVMVYSPIVHTHPIAVAGELPGHFEQWAAFDKAMIAASEGIIVVQMDGWQQSSGIAAEIEMAAALGKPVLYVPADGPVPKFFLSGKP